MMLPMSRSWTRLAEALACSFLSYMRQGGASTKLSRISRREVSMGKVGVRVALVEDPLLPVELGYYSRPSTIHEGPSLMADLIDRTLVNVSSSVGSMCHRRLTVSTYPVLHTNSRQRILNAIHPRTVITTLNHLTAQPTQPFNYTILYPTHSTSHT